MSPLRATLCLAWACAALPAAAVDCAGPLPAAGRQQVSGAGVIVAFAPSRSPIAVGQHFSVLLRLCTDDGKPLVTALRVDAEMPAHRHGMNYRPTVRDLGQGQYRADGLMFHMPGRWRLLFELGSGPQAVRLHHDLDVQ